MCAQSEGGQALERRFATFQRALNVCLAVQSQHPQFVEIPVTGLRRQGAAKEQWHRRFYLNLADCPEQLLRGGL